MYYTVVIPLFNKEKHIRRAINSVINQTHGKFELLIIDDGSTDRSYEEATSIKDNRVKIIRQENKGVSLARNKGISEAKFEYIGFLDADDEWLPDFLASIDELVSNYPNVGVYTTSYYIKKLSEKYPNTLDDDKILPGWKGIIDDYFKYSMTRPLLTASSVVIPRKVFKTLGGFAGEISKGEDTDMWVKIALNYDIALYNKVCAMYDHDTENRAGKKKVALEKSFSNYAEQILENGIKSKKCSVYFEEYMINKIIRKANYLINDNKCKEARKLLLCYKYTKLYKKNLLQAYLKSLLPLKIRSIVLPELKKFKDFKGKFMDHTRCILFI